MGFSSNKKEDIGYKDAQGILSTNEITQWFGEQYGLSPNQIPDDIWVRKVPDATTDTAADNAHTNNDFIVKHVPNSVLSGGVGYIKLVKEASGQPFGSSLDHGNSLWLARDNTGGNASLATGNRLRNFINPYNHLDSTGAISVGYTVKLYKSTVGSDLQFPTTAYDFQNAGGSGNSAGNSEYVTINKTIIPNNTDDFSISCWVKFDTVAHSQALFCKNDSGGGNDFLFGAWLDGSNLKWASFFDVGGASMVSHKIGTNIAANTWYHVVSTYELSGSNTINKIYINGELDATGTLNNAKLSDTNYYNTETPWSIGIEYDGTTRSDGFDGKMGQFSVFNSTLSSSEVEAIFNNGNGLDLTNSSGNYSNSNLLAYYKFDGSGIGAGTVLYDSASGNNNNGTLSLNDSANWLGITHTVPGPDLSAGGQINTNAMWSFYYKEGALVWSKTAADQTVLSGYETNGGKYLWAIAYQYVGPTLAANNDGSISDGDVLTYNSTGNYMEWTDGGTGSGGTDPLTVVLTNPTSFVACDANGNPDTATGSAYTNTATDIKVFRGTTQLTYNSTLADNKWKIQGTPATSGITLGSSNSVDDENHAGYNGHHTILSDSATVTYTVRVQNATGGGYVDLTITQAIDKLKKGSTGPAGNDAYSATLSNEAHAFQANVAGTVTNFTGSKTSVRAYKGTQELNSVSTTPSTGQFKVTRTIDPSGAYTPGTEDITGDEYISNDGTAITQDVVVVKFEINCENNTTIIKEQKLVKIYKGDQGDDKYTWIKYADNANGSIGFTDNPSGKDYIGLKFNNTSSTESNTASDYTWSLIKGANGSDATVNKTNIESALNGDPLSATGGGTGLSNFSDTDYKNSNVDKTFVDALGINASTVDGKTVAVNVPSGAVFTDTQLDKAGIDALNVDAGTVDGKTVAANVPSGAVFTDTQLDKAAIDALNVDAGTVDGKTVAVNVPSGALFTDTQLDKAGIDALNVDAGTVDGKTVAVNVPSGAVFTDTQLTKSDIDTLNVDAGTVDGKTVAVNVPSGAVFTDTQLDKAGVEALAIQTVGQLTSGSLGTGFTAITGANIGNLNAGKITSGEFGVDRIPTITSAKISDVEVGSDKQDVASGVGKVVTGDAVYNRANQDDWGVPEGTAVQSTGEQGGTKFLREDGDGTCSWQTISSGGASELNDLSDVLKVGSYSPGDMWVYNQSSGKFKNTKVVGQLTSVSANSLIGVLVSDTNQFPAYKIDSVTESISGTSYKQGRISTIGDFIVQLDSGNQTSDTRRFRVQDGAGSVVWFVDENGRTGGTKFTDASGNDKIDFETDKIKFHEHIKAVTGKFKDNSDVTRIDYSGTDMKFSGNVQYTGSSPATIKGPDADKLNIESVDDLDFKIASAGASSKSFKFYNNTTEIAKIENDGAVHGKNFTFNSNPGRIYDSGGNIPIYFDALGGSYITGDLSVTSLKSASDMVFQVDFDESSAAGTNSFQFKNGAGTEIANLNESGDLQIDGDLTLSGLSIMNADSEVTISVDADQNAIFNGAVRILTGTLKNLMGNTCITMDGSTTDVSVASKFTTGGNIELGHASDTTIARSAAGTVTIEGKEIVTKNKIYDFKVSAFFSTYTDTAYSIPFGGTLSETTFLTANSYSNIYPAPFDGRVVRIVSKEQRSNSGTSELELFLDHSSTKTGSTISVGSFTNKFEVDCPADWVFSKGETIAIKRKDTSYSGGTSMNIVFEFDATT